MYVVPNNLSRWEHSAVLEQKHSGRKNKYGGRPGSSVFAVDIYFCFLERTAQVTSLINVRSSQFSVRCRFLQVGEGLATE